MLGVREEPKTDLLMLSLHPSKEALDNLLRIKLIVPRLNEKIAEMSSWMFF